MGRRVDVEIRAKNGRLRADLRKAESDLRGFGKEAGSGLKSAFSAGLGNLAGLASFGGLAAVGADVFRFEDELTRLGIQGGSTAAQLDNVRKIAHETGREFGLASKSVLSAATAITNLEGASGFSAEKMRLLAKVGVATGENLDALAGVGFALNNAFKLDNIADLEGAFSAVVRAGKEGSVPLTEMSTVLQQIAITFRKVSAGGKAGAADLAAAIQVGRKGFGSSGETATGIKAFIGQLEQNSAKLKAFGVDVLKTGADGKKSLRPLREILDQIAKSRMIKDPKLLTKAFGSMEARQFLEILIANRGEFDKLAASAMNADDVQEDSAKYLQSRAGRMKVALAKIRGEFEGLFTAQRMEQIASGAEILADAVGFVVDHMKELVAIALVFKGLQLGHQAMSFARSFDALASSTGSFGAALGKTKGGLASLASGLGGALATGLALGTALDQILGISDKISDLAAGVGEEKTRAEYAAGIRKDVASSAKIAAEVDEKRSMIPHIKGGKRFMELFDKSKAGKSLSTGEQDALTKFVKDEFGFKGEQFYASEGQRGIATDFAARQEREARAESIARENEGRARTLERDGAKIGMRISRQAAIEGKAPGEIDLLAAGREGNLLPRVNTEITGLGGGVGGIMNGFNVLLKDNAAAQREALDQLAAVVAEAVNRREGADVVRPIQLVVDGRVVLETVANTQDTRRAPAR